MLLVWDVKKTLLKGDTVFAEPKTATLVFINGACVPGPLLRSPAQERAASAALANRRATNRVIQTPQLRHALLVSSREGLSGMQDFSK